MIALAISDVLGRLLDRRIHSWPLPHHFALRSQPFLSCGLLSCLCSFQQVRGT